jgi:hypothetical protein
MTLLALVGCSGCSSHRALRRSESVVAAERTMAIPPEQKVRLEYQPPLAPPTLEGIMEGRLRTDGKAGFLVFDDLGRSTRIPLGETHRISYTDRARGASTGFIIGALPGIIAGLMVSSYATAMCDSACDSGPCHCSNGATTLKALAVGGLLTGGLGALRGAAYRCVR